MFHQQRAAGAVLQRQWAPYVPEMSSTSTTRHTLSPRLAGSFCPKNTAVLGTAAGLWVCSTKNSQMIVGGFCLKGVAESQNEAS